MERDCSFFTKFGSCAKFFNGECRDRHPPACTFKSECANDKCEFLHASGWCRFGKRCSKPDCAFRHPRLCKFGLSCKNKNETCEYRHLASKGYHDSPAKPQETQNQSSRESSTEQQQEKQLELLTQLMTKTVRNFDYFTNKVKSSYFKLKSSGQYDTALLKALQCASETATAQRDAAQTAWNRFLQRSSTLSSFELNHLAWREAYRLRHPRPILAQRPQIEETVRNNQVTFILGTIGCGKSSQLASFLADQIDFKGKLIIYSHPDSLDVEVLASRVAYEFASGSQRFSRVGLSVGTSEKSSQYTRIKMLSNDELLATLVSENVDAFLATVGCIVLDDVHLRARSTDLLIGILGDILSRMPSLKLIISALPSLNLADVRQKFHQAPEIRIKRPEYPVKVLFKNIPSSATDASVQLALDVIKATNKIGGDIQCFLPSKDEADIAAFNFERSLRRLPQIAQHIDILLLHEMQTAKERSELLLNVRLNPGRRRVYFCSHTADRSMGPSDIKFIIDSGLQVIRSSTAHDPNSSFKNLPISQERALLRASIASGTQGGVCYRLYSERNFDFMPSAALPEIKQCRLSSVVLQLLHLKQDPSRFSFLCREIIDEHVTAAINELRLMNLASLHFGSTELTLQGKKAAALTTLDPGIVSMLLQACSQGLSEAGCEIAGLVSVASEVLFHPPLHAEGAQLEALKHAREPFVDHTSDINTLYNLYQAWKDVRDSYPSSSTVQDDDLASEASFSDENANILDLDVGDLSEDEDDETENASEAMSNAPSLNESTASAIEPSSSDDDSELQAKAEAEEEDRIDKRSLAAHVRAWCRVYGVNGASFRRSSALSRELMKILKSCGLWNQLPTEKPNSTQLRSLCLAALLPSASIHLGNGKYQCITTGAIGTISPTSSFVASAPSMASCIVWHKSSRGQLTEVVQIDSEWIKNMHKIVPHSMSTLISLSNVPSAVLLQIFGPNNAFLEQLSRLLGCRLEVDVAKLQIDALCQPANETEIRAALEDRIRLARDQIERSILEDLHIGSTRIVFGSGGQVKEILHGEDFITIDLVSLPESLNMSELHQIVSDQFPVREWRARRAQDGKQTVNVTLESAHVARECLRFLTSIIPSPKCAIPKAHASSEPGNQIRAELLLWWPTGEATGKAIATYATREEANQLLRHFSAHGAFPIGFDPNDKGAKKSASDASKPLPRIIKLFASQRYIFDTTETTVYPTYKVKLDVAKVGGKIGDGEAQFRAMLVKTFGSTPIDVVFQRKKPEAPEDTPDVWRGIVPEPLLTFVQRSEPYEDERLMIAGILYSFSSVENMELVAENDVVNRNLAEAQAAFRTRQKKFGLTRLLRASLTAPEVFWQASKDSFEKILLACRRTGVISTAHHAPKSHKVVFALRSNDAEQLSRAIRQFSTALKKIPYRHPKLQLLFSSYGKAKLFSLASAMPSIACDARNRSVYIYSLAKDDNQAIEALRKLIEEQLDQLELDKFFQIRRMKRDKLVQELENIRSKSKIHDLKLVGNRLIASGTPEAMALLEALVKPFLALPRSSSTSSSSTELDCPICFEALSDVESVCLIGCGHLFCKQCVQDYLSQSSLPVPVVCPLGNSCGKQMFLKDLISYSGPESLDKIKQMALEFFLATQKLESHCIKDGCDQILRVPPKPTSEDEEARLGGHIVFCDECNYKYCFSCSVVLQQEPATPHPNLSCAQNRSRMDISIMGRVRFVRSELLTSACPVCKKAFFDFDGCCAVSCAPPCTAKFCGFCLIDTKGDAHPHVRDCHLNPSKGSYFASSDAIMKAQAVVKRQRVVDYLKSIVKAEDRDLVLVSILSDLKDLGIAAITPAELH